MTSGRSARSCFRPARVARESRGEPHNPALHQTAAGAMMTRPLVNARPLDVWLRHLKIFADLLGEIVVDFVVARDA